MRNPFRDPQMRRAFEDCVRMFEAKHKNFYAGGLPYRGNTQAGMFWRGFEGHQIGVWDDASKRELSYAYWKAGQACRKDSTP